jgi:hypothetical protein
MMIFGLPKVFRELVGEGVIPWEFMRGEGGPPMLREIEGPFFFGNFRVGECCYDFGCDSSGALACIMQGCLSDLHVRYRAGALMGVRCI